MRFMVTWSVPRENWAEVYAHFASMSDDDLAADSAGLELVGRWHDVIGRTGVAICEAPDAATLAKWLLNWNPSLDTEVTPVFDDDEAQAIGREKFPS